MWQTKITVSIFKKHTKNYILLNMDSFVKNVNRFVLLCNRDFMNILFIYLILSEAYKCGNSKHLHILVCCKNHPETNMYSCDKKWK